MNRRLTSIACGLIAVLLIAAAPMPAQAAGTLTIHNKDCTRLKGLKRERRVRVHVYATQSECTNKRVTVHIGESETVSLKGHYKAAGRRYICHYSHEAHGASFGNNDVKGTEVSSVTCKKDRVDYCHCKKD